MIAVNVIRLLLGFVLVVVRGNLNDQDLYVANYYPQSHYQYQALDQDDYVRPGYDEASYFVDYASPLQYNNRGLEKNVLEYFDKNGLEEDDANALNKRVLTSFRERMERVQSKEQQDQLAEKFLRKLQEAEDRQPENEYDNRDYIEMIEDLWEKYKNTPSQSQYDKDAPVFVGEVKKRQIPMGADYSTLGWSGVGYRKRFYVKSQPPSPDLYNNYPAEFLYTKRKRFPVAKRSSNFYSFNAPAPASGHHHKRGVTNVSNKKPEKKLLVAASGTDPKVVQDLSNIFGNKQNATEKKKSGPKKVASSTSSSITMSLSATASPSTAAVSNKQLQSNSLADQEHLNIKKKSVDWSNYFGIDRRKKKSQSFTNDNTIDNDWLIKRYNNAVAMAVKRSSEYPLNIFRDHNEKKDDKAEIEENKKSDETNLRDMDNKLKIIKDLMIDEALKYTGAHEGETDPSEIQQVKDKVISRLAAAYSIEKMRRALSQFKSSLTTQKYEDHNRINAIEPVSISASTSDSKLHPEPEPDATEPEPEADKKSTEPVIKCPFKEGCEDTNEIQVNLPNSVGRCNIIENRCHKLMNGGYSDLFIPLCKWHQLCYLCQDSIDVDTCDMMFLTRADAVCRADVMCQWAARPVLAYLRQLQDIALHCDRAAICPR